MNPPFSRGAIEPLEARIAPATILFQTGLINPPTVGNPGEIDYTDANGGAEDAFFINTEADPNDPIAAVVGIGAPGVADTFYARLTAGAILKVFNDTGFQPLISGDIFGNQGIAGTMIAFFVDKNLDNEVQLNELTGLAIGNKVRAIISGSVDGDVVANYNDATGRLGGSAEAPGTAAVLPDNGIANLTISGGVSGSVVSGGAINKLKVTGKVNTVVAGTAAANYVYDFNTPTIADGGDTLTVNTPAPGVKGVSILRSTIGELNLLQAGNGGAGAAGGAVSQLTILGDQDGFVLRAGNGGSGIAGRSGGAGGAMSSVIVNGLNAGEVDTSANSLIEITAGNGGDGSAGSKGGKGGTAQKVFVGFEQVLGVRTPQISVTSFADEVTVQAGVGGTGVIAGKGGLAKNISIFASPTGSQNDLVVLGGDGGAATAGATAKAGAGGKVSNIFVLNPSSEADAHNSKLIVHAGDGGATPNGGSGGTGGAISAVEMIGYSHELRGGQGSAGITGGRGGALKNILLRDGPEGVRPENVLLDGGVAGVGLNGKGGAGGSVTDVTVRNGDLKFFAINSTALAGDGAASKSGAGGKGGVVKNIFVTEPETATAQTANAGTAMIRAGNGGTGGDAGGGAGGRGGTITSVTMSAVQLDLTAVGGNGGNAQLSGRGGNGGALSGVFFASFKQAGGNEVSATLSGGNGGNGVGASNGGRGGQVGNSSITLGRSDEFLEAGVRKARVDGGPVRVTGGVGGNAGAGGGGTGGSVVDSTFASFAGDVSVAASNAGTGAKPAKGGRVERIAIDVGQKVTVVAGNGTGGGAGGTISNVGFSRAVEDADLVDADDMLLAAAASSPLSDVTFTAGNGSGAGRAAGAGGSVRDLAGYVGLTGITSIKAGDAGAVPSKAASGGSIVDVSLFGGGGPGAEVRLQAGDAGDATTVTVGGKGGNVSNVGIGVVAFAEPDPLAPPNLDNSFAIIPETIIRYIAAGDGGDTGLGSGKGGAGGSVTNLNVHYPIGDLSGEAFGLNTMGGIFAGSGGINAVVAHSPTTLDPRDGHAGSVVGVTADSIASIVAGRPVVGTVLTMRNLVTKVDRVLLNGLGNSTVVDENGTFTNFDTANLIGGVKDPEAVGVPYDDGNPSTPPVLHPHANTFDETADPLTTEFVDNDNNDQFSLGDATTENTDGFIAAIDFLDNLVNVRPEAVLTLVNGTPTFIDLNNTNGQKQLPASP